jgi:carbonic anhydrase
MSKACLAYVALASKAVDFYILSTLQPMTQTQLDKFKAAIGWKGQFNAAGGNFRPPQALNGRTIDGCAVLGKSPAWYPYDASNWAFQVHGHTAVCYTGLKQSPIDFPECDGFEVQPAIAITWATQKVQLTNNGHTVKLAITSPSKAGKMAVDGVAFTLAQCHFHWGSEHRVNGVQLPFEAHCVHLRDDAPGNYGVFGVFFELGASTNPFLAQFEDDLPVKPANRRLDQSAVNVFGEPVHHEKLPARGSHRSLAEGDVPVVANYAGPVNFKMLYGTDDLTLYWHYQGSFTTPPCTEAVEFYIMIRQQVMTQAQLVKFKAAIGWSSAGGNFRPPQPIGGRTISGCRPVQPLGYAVASEASSWPISMTVLAIVSTMLQIL